jgi:SAM-dependent methyltransferase
MDATARFNAPSNPQPPPPDPRVDFGKTAEDYARHRAGFPPALFDRLAAGWGIGLPGQRVLDLASGTGTLARGFAARGCDATALDVSPAMLDQAMRMAGEQGVSIRRVDAPAEATGLPAASFDVVAAGQCWHWFDRAKAAAEVRRLVAPGGWLLICHFDWIPLPGNVVELAEQAILRHNPQWRYANGTGIYPAWTRDAALAGFRDLESFTFDVDVPYSREGWLGRVRASAGVAGTLPPEMVAAFDADHRAAVAERFPQEAIPAPHRVFALVGKAPSKA